MENDKLIVGIADMKLAQAEGVLITYALGSCVGICLYDTPLRLGALVHIMLPSCMDGAQSPLKYADTGIRTAMRQMQAKGAQLSRLTAKIAGGARMFEVTGGGDLGNIGSRNVESVKQVLRQERIRILAEDVGGRVARTLLFDVATGQACIRSYGRPEQII